MFTSNETNVLFFKNQQITFDGTDCVILGLNGQEKSECEASGVKESGVILQNGEDRFTITMDEFIAAQSTIKVIALNKSEVKMVKRDKKEKVVKDKSDSKKFKAAQLYKQLKNNGKARKDIIEAFMKEIGLTFNGAATYVYNFGANGPWTVDLTEEDVK